MIYEDIKNFEAGIYRLDGTVFTAFKKWRSLFIDTFIQNNFFTGVPLSVCQMFVSDGWY